MVGDIFKVRVVRYLRVGGVAFGLCSSKCAVIHAVWLLCAEWLKHIVVNSIPPTLSN